MERRKRKSGMSGATTTVYIQEEMSKRRPNATAVCPCYEMITSPDIMVEAILFEPGPVGV